MARREIYNTVDCKERLMLVVIGKDEYGGYKQDLLENDLDEMGADFCVCSKCNGVMRNACLVNGPDQLLVCEVCKLGEDSIPMVKTRTNISKLRAKCPLKKSGCEWKGNLGEIDTHLDECAEFILSCPKICGVLLKRSELQNHSENECQLRIVKCEYCEATIQYKVLKNHNGICLEFPLLCPNECLKSIIRKELKSHIEKECPKTLVACPYKEMGCEVLSKRSELPKHEKIFETKHLDITRALYFDKVKKMGSIIQEQKDEIEQLTAKVRNVEKECQRLRISESPILALAIPSVEVDELTEPIKVNSGPNEELEEEIALQLPSKSSTEQQKSGHEKVKTESKDFEIPILKIKIKFPNQEGIVCNTVYPLDIDQYIKYYEFVRIVYQVLSKGVKGVSFTSVELYSETGYPLAPTPSIYIQPLSNWGLRDNELIYAYPKKLFNNYQFVSDVECDEFVISIQLKHSQIRKEFKFTKEHVFYSDLKILLSLDMHIPIGCINIHYFNLTQQCEQIAPDNMGISKKSIDKRNLSFTVSDTYNDNEPFSAFHSVYTSCYPSNFRSDFDKFDAYLLYLVREYGENRDRDRLLRRLGLLRKISCSPPLVYSLYLLFTQSHTSLPHRIAINEGIITTISILSTSSDTPTISKFPQLWMHIEEHALTPDLQLTEIYETTFISKRTRENPRDADTRRLLQAFPPNQDTIITWRNVSSTHDAFSYTPPTKLEDFFAGVKLRFPLQHPVQLYKSFVEERKSYGLMLPLIRGLSSPCVFLGRTEGRYGYFNYFSPEDGRCYSYNPHDINISERLDISNINSYPKIIIILDISSDMSLPFLENSYNQNRLNLILCQLDAAMMLIETLVDCLIGSQCKYLLGAIVISNNHEIQNGYFEIIKPTFEYSVVLKELENYVKKFKPSFIPRNRLSSGIILNSLEYCIDEYSSPSKELKTKIFLLTNSETRLKYYGAKKSSFEKKLCESSSVVNNIILSLQFAHNLEVLSKISKGIHLTEEKISKYVSNENNISPPTNPILQFSSVLQDMFSGVGVQNGNCWSYNLLSSKVSGQLMITEELFHNSERYKVKYEEAMISQGTISNCIHILRKVTAYIKSPNPYCKLHPFKNKILNWIIFMQGPIHSPFEDSILILELYFGKQYPHYPPKLRFLSSVYHPNVDKAGHICHPILIEDYSPSVSLRQILDAIHSMLARPIISHAVRSKVLEIAIWYNKLYIQTANSLSKILGLEDRALSMIEEDFEI